MYGLPTVIVRLPHRGLGSVLTTKCPHISDTAEVERQQGRPFLQRR